MGFRNGNGSRGNSLFVLTDGTTVTGGSDNSQLRNIRGANFDYNLVGIYVKASVDISSLVSASTTYRLCFTWINDNFGSNTQPPASIDDIKVIVG